MPPQYGITATGFVKKPLSAIIADIQARQRADISSTLDLSENTPWGKDLIIKAQAIADAWDQLEHAYNGFDRDKATGTQLDALGKLISVPRRGSSYTLVELSCTLLTGTVLESGVHYAAVDGDSESLWTPVVDYTAATDGAQLVWFRAENVGPIEAVAGSITVIHTSVLGWSAVGQPEDADVGRPIDDDPTYRERQETQLAAAGSATSRAIRADVLELDGVISCTVFENDSDDEVDGLPPHSFEVLVYDGESPSVDNALIAQAIWNTRAGGIRTYGSASGTAFDAQGSEHTVYFSRPTPVPIYIEIDADGEDLDTSALAAYFVERATTLCPMGEDVRVRRLDSLIFGQPGVEDVTAFRVGLTASPVGTTNLPIAPREIASFDTSRTTVTEA